ncbi:hypothetical protein CBR_g23604 [Chara braunii]|uniref:Uncharacterized protein n=1 Tax=Chara braunii TaxID=69332 RepID=A0A388L4P4_CHABU|nr:hypothetical protein CBR_g23604 [Chara braunii]|eukprot:GBG77275.1 hypothetical protein CBR_g23604 [Chara braunii]
MIRLFNYVVFKTEGRKEDEWNDEFFIGYSRIMDRFAPTGLTKEQWEENKTKVPAHKAKDVPKHLGDIDEPKVGKVGGFKLTRTLYAKCPYYLKVFMHEIIGAIDQLRDELRRISANARYLMWDANNDHTTFLPICSAPYEALQPSEEITRAVKKLNCHLAVLDLCPRKSTAPHEWSDERFAVLPEMMNTFLIPGRWERYLGKDQYVVPAGNLPVRPRDCMTVVMHALNNDYKKVTVQPRNHVTWFDDNVKEDLFVQCTNEHIGISGDTKAVYGHWEREPKKVKELCKWFAKDGEGVLLLGNVQAGSVWEVLRPGHNVVACDSNSTMLDWTSTGQKVVAISNDPKLLGVLRETCTSSLVRRGTLYIGYIHRKVIVIQHLQGYHGAIEIFMARCECLWFNKQEERLRAKTYADELDAGEHFDVRDSEEETSDEDINLSVPGAQQDVRQALDSGKGHQAMERIETGVVASRESVRGGEQRSCEQGMQENAGNEIRGPVGATNASKNSNNEGLHARAASLSEKEPRLQSKCKESSVRYPGILTQLDNVYVSMGLSKIPREKQYNVPQVENAQVSEMGVDAIKFALPPNEDDKLMPGDTIQEDMKEFIGGRHFIQHIGTVVETEDHQWGHHILWHPKVFEPCVWNGKWHMAVCIDGQWQLQKRVLKSKFFEIAKEQVHIKVRQANGGSDSLAEGAYADALYDKLRDQNMLEYNANFYDIESNVSHGRIPWKLPSREVVQEFEGEICLGNSQQLGHDDGHASASAAGRPFTSFVHSDKQVHERNDIDKSVGDSDESRSDRMQTEQQLSHPPSQREGGQRLGGSLCNNGISQGGVLEGRPGGVQMEENVEASMGKDDDELQRATTIGDKHQQPKRKRKDDDIVIDIVTQSGEQSGCVEDGEVGQNEKEQEEHQHVTLQKEDVICNEKPRKGNINDNIVLRRSARPAAKKTRHGD